MEKYLYVFVAVLFILHISLVSSLWYLIYLRKLTPRLFAVIFTLFFNLPLAFALLILSGVFRTKPIQWMAVIFTMGILAFSIISSFIISYWLSRHWIPGFYHSMDEKAAREALKK
jgi:hypothetical protein